MSVDTLALADSEEKRAKLDPERLPILHFRKPYTEKDDYRDVLALAVIQGLSAFGEGVAQVVLYNLDKRYSLNRRDIVKKPDRFVEALQAMFGSGTTTIERLIIQSICTSTGLNPETLNQPTLPHCIEQAKKILKTK